MPYIENKNNIREDMIADITMVSPKNAGELNYLISSICGNYILEKGERYQYYNDIIGALEGAKLEIYRRLVGSYEDKAIYKNGDLAEYNRILADRK